MKNRRKIVVVSVIVLIVISVFLRICFSAKMMYRRAFHSELPAHAQVVHFAPLKQWPDVDAFCLKVQIDAKDAAALQTDLSSFYQKQGEINVSADDFNRCGSAVSWWDLDKNRVVFAHKSFSEGMFVKTILCCSFLTVSADGQYTLYVAVF